MTSQSIILNLNKDFAKSTAHSYLQPVAQAFDIGSEAEVALYGATLQRKPLLVEDNTDNGTDGFTSVKCNFVTLPSVAQLDSSLAGTYIDQDKLVKPYNRSQNDVDIKIEQGAYSVGELANRLVIGVNSSITQQVDGKAFFKDDGNPIQWNGKDVKNQLPYAMTFKKDPFYLGFQGVPFRYIDNETASQYPPQMAGLTLPTQQFTLDNNEANRDASTDIQFEKADDNLKAIKEIRCNTAVNVIDWSRYGRISDSPLFPLMKQDSMTQLEEGFAKNQTYFEWKVDFNNTANNYKFDACVGFTNTYLQSAWASLNVPDTSPIIPTGSGGVVNYPQCLLGVRMYEDYQGGLDESFLEVFAPALLSERLSVLDGQDDLENIFDEDLVSLYKVDMRETELEGLTIGFRFCAKENEIGVDFHQQEQTGTVAQGRDLYNRVYSFQLYVDNSQGEHVLYDSADRDVFIPGNLIDDGIFMNAVESERVSTERVNLGFQPYIWVNDMQVNDDIAAIRGNYLAYFDYTDDYFIVRTPATDYEYELNSKSLRECLGLSEDSARKITVLKGDTLFEKSFEVNNQRRFNPNAFPRYLNEAGLTQLYSDNTQYNVEINLPIKAYNTTTSTLNNIGQKRTIVYKTEPVVEGESQGISQVYVNKNIVPNNLKFLTLNNSEKLNINNMEVQIRRAHNNELATELEDASVELLVKSK
jgi:hypothetical protein